FERARTEALRAAGLQQSATFERDLSFVLHTIQLRFHAPAHLDDELVITCRLTRAKGASLTFAQEVRELRGGQLLCTAEAVVACMRLSTKRPCRVPDSVRVALATH